MLLGSSPSGRRETVRLAAAIVLLWTANPAGAQGCRVGSGPDLGDGIPYCDDGIGVDDTELGGGDEGHWEARWGAIAIDPQVNRGGVGVASGEASRAAAEAAALRGCRGSGGGETCLVQLSYGNQCAVVAWGEQYFTTANAPTIEEARRIGLEDCGKRTRQCRIFYSDCSFPELVG